MRSLFKEKHIAENLSKLLHDPNFTIKRFWFKKVYIQNILENEPKLQAKTGNKVLEMYNSYHESDLALEDIFNTESLINYKQNAIEFRFKTDAPKEVAFKFIEKILSIQDTLVMNVTS